MKCVIGSLVVGAGVLAMAGGALAQVVSINSFQNNFRNFDDFPASNLVASSNFALGTISISEDNFGQGQGGQFANRHRVFDSNDAGATRYKLQNNQPFDISVDVTVSSSHMRSAEAGFYFDTVVGGEPRYISKANDAVFAFDSWLPFVYAGGIGNSVTTNLRWIYTPGDGAGNTIPATVQFFRDGLDQGTFNAGNFASPDFVNGFANNTIMGFYAQFSPQIDGNGLADPLASASAVFENLHISVPAPGAGALAVVGLAGMIRRRRR